jgi:hypothetical protein
MENFNKESTSQQPYRNPENRAVAASSSSGTAARMKLADMAADMKDRVTAKPWTNSTIPAKQLQALSTPQPQLSILTAIKFPAPPTQPPTRYTPPLTTFVRPMSRGWLLTLKLLYNVIRRRLWRRPPSWDFS